MRFYEYLEDLESEVEIQKEDETQIFDEDNETIGKPYKNQLYGKLYDSLDEFYEICLELKASLEALQVLEEMGDDMSAPMQITKNRINILIQDAKINFNLSNEEIENIRNDIFGKSDRKIR